MPEIRTGIRLSQKMQDDISRVQELNPDTDRTAAIAIALAEYTERRKRKVEGEMEDRQLAILIRAWANRLEMEIDALRVQMPESMERVQVTEYIGSSMLPGLDRNPESWRDVDGDDFVALAGLRNLLAELRRADEQLSTGIETK